MNRILEQFEGPIYDHDNLVLNVRFRLESLDLHPSSVYTHSRYVLVLTT